MIKKRITLGETYVVRYAGKIAGVSVPFDGTWTASFRVSLAKIGGPTVADIPLQVVDGKFVATIDTSLPPYKLGTYYYDVRITPPGGTPQWHGQTALTLDPKNSPAS